jgi:hypothetical protein
VVYSAVPVAFQRVRRGARVVVTCVQIHPWP